MDYIITPFSDVWNDGVFNVPSVIAQRYLKMASGKQIKALLYILSNGGKAKSPVIAKALGITSNDVDEILEFWVEEGVINKANAGADSAKQTAAVKEHNKITKKELSDNEHNDVRKKIELLPAPRLTPKDIIDACRENEQLDSLLNEAQVVLNRTISTAEQEMLVNMVNYYGLRPEVVLMLLGYYRSEKEKGRPIGISYINKMANNWAEENIETAADADKKLMEIMNTDAKWHTISDMAGIAHKIPTVNQRNMIKAWCDNFDMDMISAACDIMRENADKPTLKYIDRILSRWKKENVKCLADVAKQQQEFDSQKTSKRGGKSNQTVKKTATYDIEQIKQDMMNNTDIKF